MTMSDKTIYVLRDAINSHDPNEVTAAFTEDYRCDMPMHPSRDFSGSTRFYVDEVVDAS